MKNAVLSLLLGIAWVTAAGPVSSSDANVPDLSEISAKDFEVVTLEGDTIPFAKLIEGGRPVVIEFWATWCIPCRKTLPHLVELHERYPEDLVVVGLTVEEPTEDLEKVRDFVREQRVSFPIAFAPDELFQFMNDRPDVAVPKLFVFDETGRVVTYIPRYSPFTQRKLRAAVKKVLSRN